MIAINAKAPPHADLADTEYVGRSTFLNNFTLTGRSLTGTAAQKVGYSLIQQRHHRAAIYLVVGLIVGESSCWTGLYLQINSPTC